MRKLSILERQLLQQKIARIRAMEQYRNKEDHETASNSISTASAKYDNTHNNSYIL